MGVSQIDGVNLRVANWCCREASRCHHTQPRVRRPAGQSGESRRPDGETPL